MIFKTTHEGKRHQLSPAELKPYEDKIKELFPYSFREEKPIPITLKWAPEFVRNAPLYDGKGEMAQVVPNHANRKVATPNAIISAVAKVREEGSSYEVEYMYSKQYPQINEKSGRAKAKGIRIKGGDKLGYNLDPKRDFDLIIFLYFFSSSVQNNAAGTHKGAAFVFERPDQRAADDYNKLIVNQEVYNMVINPLTFDSHEDLRKVASVVGFPTSGEELVDRVKIQEHLKDEKNREKWFRIRTDIVQTRRNNADMSEINDKVVRAINANVLREDKKKKVWTLTSSGGALVMEVIGVKGTSSDEKRMNLVQHLKLDTTAMEKLNELLPEPVAA